MLDSSLKPWLIEVNVSPSLMGGSPLDKRVKGLLLSDIFHLVGVPVSVRNLPAGVLPKDLEPIRNGSSSSVSSTASLPFNRRHATGVQTAGFRRTSTTPSSSSSSSSSSAPSASSRGAINKQLHEVVLDPNIPHFKNNHLGLFLSSDWDMIHTMEDEMDRLGHFEHIFPSLNPEETAKYASFFICQRYSNALCAKWINTTQKKNSGNKSSRRHTKPKQPHQQVAKK